MMQRIPFFFLFILVHTAAFAQIKMPELKVDIKPITYIELTTIVSHDGDDLENAAVRFMKKGAPTARVLTDKKGKAKYRLDMNSEYVVMVSKAGYKTKSVSFSTYVKDSSLLVDIWPNFQFEVQLEKGKSTIEDIQEPVGRLKFSDDNYKFNPTPYEPDKIEHRDEIAAVINEVVTEFKAKEEEQAQQQQALAEAQKAKEEAEQLKTEAEALAKQLEEHEKMETSQKGQQAALAQSAAETKARAAAEAKRLKVLIGEKEAEMNKLREEAERIKNSEAGYLAESEGSRKKAEDLHQQIQQLNGTDKIIKEAEAVDAEIAALRKEAEAKKLALQRLDKEKSVNRLQQERNLLVSQLFQVEPQATIEMGEQNFKQKIDEIEDLQARERGAYEEILRTINEKEKILASAESRLSNEKEEMERLRQQRAGRMAEVQKEIEQKKIVEAQLKDKITALEAEKATVDKETETLLARQAEVKQQAQNKQGLALMSKEAELLEYDLAHLTRQLDSRKAEVEKAKKQADLKQTEAERYELEAWLIADNAEKAGREQLARQAMTANQDFLQQSSVKEQEYEQLLQKLEETKQALLNKKQQVLAEQKRLDEMAANRTKELAEAKRRAELLKQQAEQQAKLEEQKRAEAERLQAEAAKRAQEEEAREAAAADVAVKIDEELDEKGKETILTTIVTTKTGEDEYQKITAKSGASKHIKNGRPITERTYELELGRRKEELAQANGR